MRCPACGANIELPPGGEWALIPMCEPEVEHREPTTHDTDTPYDASLHHLNQRVTERRK